MSELSNEQQPERSMGALEAMTEGVKVAVQAYAPGLTMEKFFGDVGSEMSRLGVQGAAELAQALFTGGGGSYVPYGRGQDSPKDHDNGNEQAAQPEGHGVHGAEQQQERGGMGR